MASGEWLGGALLVVAFVVLLLRPFLPVRGVADLSAGAFRAKWEQTANGLLIDVREPREYRSGHIRQAVNVPLSRWAAESSRLPKDRPIFVYCQSGMRSKSAAKRLAKTGHGPIYNLRGGVAAWPDRLV